MKERRILLRYKGQSREITLKVCNWFWMVCGLMFARRKSAEALLLFDFDEPRKWKIHSYFVFFPFVALWLDEKNKIIEKRVVKPFTLFSLPKEAFSKLIEIPINERYSEIVKFLVGSRKSLKRE